MTPTAYGYKIPDYGDLSKGSTGWMEAQDFNWERISAHTHDGVDSPLLTVAAFASFTVTAPAASWVANPGGAGLPVGGYKQTVLMPSAITEVNDYMVKFLISTVGVLQYQQVFLDYTRNSGTSIDIYSNDNTISILCVFR
jgi:hypothetical protein